MEWSDPTRWGGRSRSENRRSERAGRKRADPNEAERKGPNRGSRATSIDPRCRAEGVTIQEGVDSKEADLKWLIRRGRAGWIEPREQNQGGRIEASDQKGLGERGSRVGWSERAEPGGFDPREAEREGPIRAGWSNGAEPSALVRWGRAERADLMAPSGRS